MSSRKATAGGIESRKIEDEEGGVVERRGGEISSLFLTAKMSRFKTEVSVVIRGKTRMGRYPRVHIVLCVISICVPLNELEFSLGPMQKPLFVFVSQSMLSVRLKKMPAPYFLDDLDAYDCSENILSYMLH